MDKIVDIIQVVVAEWQAIIVSILTIVGGASAILKVLEKIADITPWHWDNKIIGFMQKVLEVISLKLK